MGYSISNPAPERPAEQSSCDRHGTGEFTSGAKRVYDVVFSASGLLLLSPLFLLIGALVKIAGGGPVFYRQRRIGLHGLPFYIWKFRTMVPGADRMGTLITGDADARVTRIGRILRKTKLDELPQLWNVLKGEMSLVGPRPEVSKYVEQYEPGQQEILNLKPGITDLASLQFRNEELLLKNTENVEEFYIRHCIPRKIRLNLEYAEGASLLSDTWIILQTICPYWLSLLCVYSLILAAAFWLSCQFIYDFALPRQNGEILVEATISVVVVQLGCLIWRRQCKGLLSYFSIPELKQIMTALGFSCLLLLGLRELSHHAWPPRNVILLDSLVATCAVGGFRLLLRIWRENASSGEAEIDSTPVRVGIIGAGRVGSRLLRELTTGRQSGRTVVAFFDDNCQKWHRCIHEVPVIGMPECLLDGWNDKLDEVILAIPDVSVNRIREVRRMLQQLGLKAYTAPATVSLCRGNDHSFAKRTPL
jgi:lipopolysaccharide/colanic/teichoic acid biosynthesis glycosyltransferase